LQSPPKFTQDGIFGLKICHLATLSPITYGRIECDHLPMIFLIASRSNEKLELHFSNVRMLAAPINVLLLFSARTNAKSSQFCHIPKINKRVKNFFSLSYQREKKLFF
jgi:hypothetical protein